MANRAPTGDLSTFEQDSFAFDGENRPIYRKGSGAAVIVITEMPGITPMVLGFAGRVAAAGHTVVLPHLYGTAGRDPEAGSTISNLMYGVRSMAGGCISRDFSTYALDRTSPVAEWLRALARSEHERSGGPGVGVVGMCFSGGFALAMATDPAVVAPVMSQPSLPLPVPGRKMARPAIDVSEADLDRIVGRYAAEGLGVLGLRFEGDSFVPEERFAYLSDRLGNAFLSVELAQADGHTDGLDGPGMSAHHSVLTTALVDEPGTPTRNALDQVLDFLGTRLEVGR